MKQYNFTGKKTGLFVTSHKAGVEKAEAALQSLCPKANWKKGFLANGKSVAELKKWTEGIGC
ncbi:hypothetical protein K420107F6_44300 [Lactonifactor longoviformis]